MRMECHFSHLFADNVFVNAWTWTSKIAKKMLRDSSGIAKSKWAHNGKHYHKHNAGRESDMLAREYRAEQRRKKKVVNWNEYEKKTWQKKERERNSEKCDYEYVWTKTDFQNLIHSGIGLNKHQQQKRQINKRAAVWASVPSWLMTSKRRESKSNIPCLLMVWFEIVNIAPKVVSCVCLRVVKFNVSIYAVTIFVGIIVIKNTHIHIHMHLLWKALRHPNTHFARPINDNNNDMAIILNGLTMYKINLNSINGRPEMLYM